MNKFGNFSQIDDESDSVEELKKSGVYWQVLDILDTRKIKLADRGFLRDSNWNEAVGINYKYFTDRYGYDNELLGRMIARELDILADDCQPICKSYLDDNYYMVNFATKPNDYNERIPLCWTKIEKADDYPAFSWDEIRKLQDAGFEIQGIQLVYNRPVPTLPLGVGHCSIHLVNGEYHAPNAETVDYLKQLVSEILCKD